VEQESDESEEIYGSADSFTRILERIYRVLF